MVVCHCRQPQSIWSVVVWASRPPKNTVLSPDHQIDTVLHPGPPKLCGLPCQPTTGRSSFGGLLHQTANDWRFGVANHHFPQATQSGRATWSFAQKVRYSGEKQGSTSIRKVKDECCPSSSTRMRMHISPARTRSRLPLGPTTVAHHSRFAPWRAAVHSCTCTALAQHTVT